CRLSTTTISATCLPVYAAVRNHKFKGFSVLRARLCRTILLRLIAYLALRAPHRTACTYLGKAQRLRGCSDRRSQARSLLSANHTIDRSDGLRELHATFTSLTNSVCDSYHCKGLTKALKYGKGNFSGCRGNCDCCSRNSQT